MTSRWTLKFIENINELHPDQFELSRHRKMLSDLRDDSADDETTNQINQTQSFDLLDYTDIDVDVSWDSYFSVDDIQKFQNLSTPDLPNEFNFLNELQSYESIQLNEFGSNLEVINYNSSMFDIWAEELKILNQTVINERNGLTSHFENSQNNPSLNDSTTSNETFVRFCQLHDLQNSSSISNFFNRVHQCITHNFAFNTKQKETFELIFSRIRTEITSGASEENLKYTLRLYVSGMGGTGKSHLIKAIQETLRLLGMSQLLRTVAFMGAAACQISGSTLHYALNLNAKNASFELAREWKSVRFIIIDEISLVGQKLLKQLNQRLNEIYGKDQLTTILGGLNVICFGDFMQLPPVAQLKIFHPFYATGQLSGYEIWLKFDRFVELIEQVRSRGDSIYQNILIECRDHQVSLESYLLLRKRVYTNLLESGLAPNLLDNEWGKALIVTPRKKVNAILNEWKLKALAFRSNKIIYTYSAIHTIKQQPITSKDLLTFLNERSDYMSKSSNDKIPKSTNSLFVGARIMITDNLATELGVVNGALGTVCHILPDPDGIQIQSSQRHIFLTKPPLILVELDHPQRQLKDFRFRGMPSNNLVPISTKSYRFSVNYNDSRLTIQRHQLPVELAYAVTDFKVQGKTLEKVILDLEKPDGKDSDPNSAYTMLSRCKTLNGIIILRDFSIHRLNRPIDPNYTRDLWRLRKLHQLQSVNMDSNNVL